jgi:hypothetical protein
VVAKSPLSQLAKPGEPSLHPPTCRDGSGSGKCGYSVYPPASVPMPPAYAHPPACPWAKNRARARRVSAGIGQPVTRNSFVDRGEVGGGASTVHGHGSPWWCAGQAPAARATHWRCGQAQRRGHAHQPRQPEAQGGRAAVGGALRGRAGEGRLARRATEARGGGRDEWVRRGGAAGQVRGRGAGKGATVRGATKGVDGWRHGEGARRGVAAGQACGRRRMRAPLDAVAAGSGEMWRRRHVRWEDRVWKDVDCCDPVGQY